MENKEYEWFRLEFTDGSVIRSTITPLGCVVVLFLVVAVGAAVYFL
jgi:hypothetical protein